MNELNYTRSTPNTPKWQKENIILEMLNILEVQKVKGSVSVFMRGENFIKTLNYPTMCG